MINSLNDFEKREIEILRLAAQGYHINQIADELEFSYHTIKNMRHEILQKIYAKNMNHAIALAIKYGLIDVNDIQDEIEQEIGQ
jgi:LuxR family transcriptional regulator